MQKPVLSIGMIFKNEIRCLERCLKSLQPLRDALPCELVMADTGSDDGSREIAARYADILMDFPWIDDFSAARNAVMDRCSGEWYLSIDSDEWVDPNIEGYVAFFSRETDFDFASIIIRNYNTIELDQGGSYSDFLSVRFLRMSTGLRYVGAIHEHWMYNGTLRTMRIRGAVFHHDGYVQQNTELIAAKQARNLPLLRKQAEENPEDLIVLTQCVEGFNDHPEQEGYLRRALAGVNEKRSQWEMFGPPLYRHAVRIAMRDNLPELEEWIKSAEEMFPESIFLRAEIAYFAFGHYWSADNYEEAIRWGERYLQGVADYDAGRFNQADLLASSLDMTDTHSRLNVAAVLAEGYLHEQEPGKCARLLDSLDPCEMDVKQVAVCLRDLFRLYSEYGWDTNGQMLRFWERVNRPVPDRESASRRRAAFIQAGAVVFTREYRETEAGGPLFRDNAYAAFLPLEGVCPLGMAAAILKTGQPEKLEAKLREVDHWGETPVQALAHALEQGARFPLPDQLPNMETMSDLAARLAQDGANFPPLALRLAGRADGGSLADLVWIQLLLTAAVRAYPWGGKERDGEMGMALVRAFARVERAYLSRCYAPEILQAECLFALPALCRFGWYCARAFDRLDGGDMAGYVKLLREGLASCQEMQPVVEFLLDRLEEREKLQPEAPELLALAQQVRETLARYDPQSPAVEAIRGSEAYRKVRHLIEGSELSFVPKGVKQ